MNSSENIENLKDIYIKVIDIVSKKPLHKAKVKVLKKITITRKNGIAKLEGFKEGTYNFIVSLDEYITEKGQVTVSDEDGNITILLRKLDNKDIEFKEVLIEDNNIQEGVLFINVFNKEGAFCDKKISINRMKVRTDENGAVKTNINEGFNKIFVGAKGYKNAILKFNYNGEGDMYKNVCLKEYIKKEKVGREKGIIKIFIKYRENVVEIDETIEVFEAQNVTREMLPKELFLKYYIVEAKFNNIYVGNTLFGIAKPGENILVLTIDKKLEA